MLAAAILAAGACSGVLALAGREDTARVPRGTTIDGLDVSQRTEGDAVALLRSRLGRYPPPVEVRAAHRTFWIRPRRAGVWIDYRGAVRQVLARRGDPGFIERAWRELASRSTRVRTHARVHVDHRRIRKAVERIARSVRRPRRDASLRVALTSVSVRRSHVGIRLAHPRRLTRRVVAAFRRREAPHALRAETRRSPPRVTTREVRRRHPVVITVSRRERMVRVFRRGRLVATYYARAHRTPSGRFTVGTMSGVPLRIGFHHGGFRGRDAPRPAGGVVLRPADMVALYKHARIGATVLVGS